MNEKEKALLKEFAHAFSDKLLPGLIDAEIEKLPPAYAPLMMAIMAAIKPGLIAQLDKYIDEKLA